MIRFLLKEGPLGEFQGVSAVEIDGVAYTPDELEAIVRSCASGTAPKDCGNGAHRIEARSCEALDCDSPVTGLSRFCKKHDMRYRRHGDPSICLKAWDRKKGRI